MGVADISSDKGNLDQLDLQLDAATTFLWNHIEVTKSDMNTWLNHTYEVGKVYVDCLGLISP